MKLKFTLFLCALCVMGISNHLMAQVSGRVLDKDDSSPLIGASVSIKGTTQGTVTDGLGAFSLSGVEVSDTLSITYVGYKASTYVVKNLAKEIVVYLRPDNQILDEAVVIGFGTQKRSSVTGAISTVNEDEITQTPVLRVEQALQGRVSGVQITNQSGQPGDAPTITIRGVGTNGNPNPIYIVDGIQVDAIDYLNPDDIKSIDILKDAASTAIYGARGGNGVVLITTKSGNQRGANLNYSAYYGVQNPWRIIEVMDADEYARTINEGAINSGRSPLYDNPDSLGEGTDWQRELYNFNAPIFNHNVTFSDNREGTQYTVALSYFGQEGIVGGDKSRFERYTARLNLRHKFGERLRVGENFSFAQLDKAAVQSNQEFGGLISNSLNLDPITPVYMTDTAVLNDTLSQYNLNPAVRNEDGLYYGISDIIAQEIVNPLARLAVTHGGSKESKLVGNVFAEYDILENLTLKTIFGLELSNVSSNGFFPEFYLNSAQGNVEPVVTQFYGKTTIWNTVNTLNYQLERGKHHFNALVGGSIRESKYQWMSGVKSGLIVTDPEKVNLAFAADNLSAQLFGGRVENALVSSFGRIIYDYDEKYLLTLITRRDGSTKFGPSNRFGVFPSVSLGWVVSKENFISTDGALSFLKLRASWGQNGNDQISDYAWVASIASGRNYTLRDSEGNEILVNGSSPSQVVDRGLRWEASEQLDLGFDISLWDDRLIINADFFRKETKGLLIRKPVPGVAGNVAGETNVGGVLNRGIELSLAYRESFANSFLSVGINATYLQNEVLSVDGAQGIIVGASYSTYGSVTRMERGFPIGYFYGYVTDGLFQNQNEVFSHINREGDPLQPRAQPGDVRFVDLNGDGEINDEDRTIIGSPHPDLVLGFNGSYEYKNFKATFLFFGNFGNQVFNGIRRHDLTESNFPAYYDDRWQGEGTSTNIPRFALTDGNQNFSRISDVYIESGSFLRLRNLTLGYNLKPKKYIRNAYIYVAGENLLTFTGYRGLEPEIGARNGWVLDMGIDRGVYPQAKTYRIGIDIQF